MTSLVFFVEQIALGLYILCAGGILLMAYRLLRARRELALSQFKLEREQALVRQASSITLGGLLLETLVGVWAIANLMAPTLRDAELSGVRQTASRPERFVTSTPGVNPPIALDAGQPIGSGEQALFATPAPTATPVGTIIPAAPDMVGCPRDSAWLLVPGNGQLIFEATTVWGTASIGDFAFYRFEIRPAVSGTEFAPIGGDYTEPVVDGPLGEIIPLNFPTGEYRFRLTVFDNTYQMRHLCEVTIHISDPPPTPTPIGAGPASATPEA
ncbi:MAG: hypothetical protein GXY36_08695 [Chloroflexi bacterium]|nr:hypothetical protein [Chloroflexota bacterium]